MNHTRSLWLSVACLLVGIGGAQPLPGATLTGSFTSDDQLFQMTWTTPVASTFTAYTTSYANGGFVPVITLYNQAGGTYLGFDGGDARCSNGRMEDPHTGICDDAYLSLSVTPGRYLVVLSEFFNLPNGDYTDGFGLTGATTFTAKFCGTTGAFWQVDVNPCVQRTDNYSLTINPASTVPEPAMAWPVALVLIAVWYRWRFYSRTEHCQVSGIDLSGKPCLY